MTDSLDAASEAGDGLDWDEESLPVEEVRALFVTLGKAFRAYQLS